MKTKIILLFLTIIFYVPVLKNGVSQVNVQRDSTFKNAENSYMTYRADVPPHYNEEHRVLIVMMRFKSFKSNMNSLDLNFLIFDFCN